MAMGLPTVLLLLLLLLLVGASLSAATNTSAAAAPSSSSSTQLDPKQARALQSLGLPTTINNPCISNSSLPGSTELEVECDTSTPLRHVLSLSLTNCRHHTSVTTTALKYLFTLHSLRLINCPSPAAPPPRLPPHLHSFTCIASLRPLTGVWLSRLRSLSLLTVSGVPINASGPAIILGPLKYLQSATISNASLTGRLPKSWQSHRNLTHLDLSLNQLRGKIPPSLTSLDTLVSLNLSSNQLSGELPTSIGDLIQLRNLSFASNSLSGPIPESLAAVPSLARLDLSSNQLNGTIPGFLGEMKELEYLNLESNSFQGVMPFNATFIRGLRAFKIGQNPNLCYNHTTLLSGMKLGIAPCDSYGLPMSPPTRSVDSGGSDESDYSDSSDEEASQNKEQRRHQGPNRVVLGVAIAISSIIFLIIFLILLSKWCA